MNNKYIMEKFIKSIEDKKQLTTFIKNIFDYQNFNDYNYLFRLTSNQDSVIIDIYDNISTNRFNRYIFLFQSNIATIKRTEENNVFITYIYVENVENTKNKLLKLAYLFKIEKYQMIEYAKTFLDKTIIDTLKETINSITYL